MKLSKSRLIQLIHVGKGKLQWDDAFYREILVHCTGKDSCSKMNAGELNKVLNYMKSKGFEVITKKRGKGRNSPITRDKDQKTPLDKLRQTWIAMKSRGYLRDGSEQALLNWSKSQAKRLNKGAAVERLEWLKPTMLHALIEQLKGWYQREMVTELKDLVPDLRALPLSGDEQHEAKSTVYEHGNFSKCNVEQLEAALAFIGVMLGRYEEATNG
ncbi:regulatory protein GemA [Pseudoalteromonas rubra]|uniref:Regulatory protein GemA n=1 Tax=Pseudoalteromonas rubra TaxID=43658 RepID=A0A5S3WKF3_9GAMM|nr:regulatory protein GemA [Pseudoalteromonas rubra]TMP27171.1 regulatory protein GemA [Pseudoalteromonas rubra]TMP29467.1 regulatory protein GemA [Pseudoalteromonas rubra]